MSAFDQLHQRVFEIPDLHDRAAGITTEEIAKHLDVSSTSAAALLRGMAYYGWIDSETSESDLTYWFVTDSGLTTSRAFTHQSQTGGAASRETRGDTTWCQ